MPAYSLARMLGVALNKYVIRDDSRGCGLSLLDAAYYSYVCVANSVSMTNNEEIEIIV